MNIKAIIWKDKTITYKINNKIITTKIKTNDKTKRNKQTLDRRIKCWFKKKYGQAQTF